jgi:hypothetical protein
VTLPKAKTSQSSKPKLKVFETTELIENILSFLQPKEIISCKRLSRTIRNVVDGSSLLKDLMFLRTDRAPAAPQQFWRMAVRTDGHGRGITSVRPMSGLLESPYFTPTSFEAGVYPNRTRTPAIMNPTFRPSPLFESRQNDPDAYHGCTAIDHITFSPDHLGVERFQFQDLKAHWSLMDMYLTNPPCLEAWIYFKALRHPSRIAQLEFSGLLQVPAGITVEDIRTVASNLRGTAAFDRPGEAPEERAKRRMLEQEGQPDDFENVTMDEALKLLNAEDEKHPVELYGVLRCDLLDVIIPTDRMRAGVTPYVETGGEFMSPPDSEFWH